MKQMLVIGSRGSKLALTQTRLIQNELHRLRPALETRIEIVTTSGDVKTEPLSIIGGQGVFTKELEEALLSRRIDVAVHSLKDLPTIIPDGLAIAAIGKREDPRDALIVRGKQKATIQSLAPRSVVGTSSARRLAQLKNLRPDLVFQDIRGNVDTRLQKLDEGHYEAIVLACAGLRRLGLEHRISSSFSTEALLPSPGQGALAIETRADDEYTIETVRRIAHKFTALACTAERSFLRALGGGCQLPIAAYAVVRDKKIRLDGLVADRDGEQIIRDRISGPLDEAAELGRQLAARVIVLGADKLLG